MSDWLRTKENSGEKRKRSPAPVPGSQTIHFGPVFQAGVGKAVVGTYGNTIGPVGVNTADGVDDKNGEDIQTETGGEENEEYSTVPDDNDRPLDDKDLLKEIEEELLEKLDKEPGSDSDSGATIPSPPSPTPNARSLPAPLNSIALKYARSIAAFSATYNSQNSSDRWRLASERTVEGVLYTSALALDPPSFLISLAPSFILDLADNSPIRHANSACRSIVARCRRCRRRA